MFRVELNYYILPLNPLEKNKIKENLIMKGQQESNEYKKEKMRR